MNSAERALQEVRDGMILGLGTGRAATAFIVALGERVHAGLNVRGIPTSEASTDLAWQLGIPIATLDRYPKIDLAVDGADEVDPACNLIKGYGGALVREKVVAAAADRFIVLVGEEKLVERLGARGRLPVEVLPFAVGFCRRRLEELGLKSELRMNANAPFVTDNHHHILDCETEFIDEPQRLDAAIRAIPGVIGTGLFCGMAHEVLVQKGPEVEVWGPSRS